MRGEAGLGLFWEDDGIAGHLHCGSCMTRNGLMVLMPRNTIGLECQDDVRPEAPDLLDQTSYNLPGWRLYKGVRMILCRRISPARVAITQHDGFLQAQNRTRAS